MKKYISMLMVAVACQSALFAQSDSKPTEEQLYRPNFHFTPKKGWMNDPNGLYYKDGVYHLFFQHYPDASKWGPMHWGHAISKDLVKWDEQPIALYPDELGYIFSGSSVVDVGNTSGFGNSKNNAVVATYTYHNPKLEKDGKIDVESQGMAYSLDNGKTWTKYNANPVLKNPGIRDFRDPKVFRDTKRQQWIMILAAQDRIHIYQSKDLKKWEFQSEFGKDLGGHGGVWECPDLFPLKVEGSNEEKWVMIVNINPGGPNNGSAGQYFVGDFDGKTFSIDQHFAKQIKSEKAAWLDWGKDNYASVSFDNVPQNKRVIIGWMSNWEYAQEVPTEAWRSSTTIAREVSLKKIKEGYILKNMPVAQLKNYEVKSTKKKFTIGSENKLIAKSEIDLTKAVLDLSLKGIKSGRYTFALKNNLGETLTFGIDNKKRELFVDRSKSGKTGFGNHYAEPITTAPLSQTYSTAEMKLVIDKASIEIFFNNGEKVLTEIFFPNENFTELSLSAEVEGGILNLKGSQLNIK